MYFHYLFFFFIIFPYRPLQSIEQSSLCYTAGSYQLSILYIAVCICSSLPIYPYLPPYLLVTISFFFSISRVLPTLSKGLSSQIQPTRQKEKSSFSSFEKEIDGCSSVSWSVLRKAKQTKTQQEREVLLKGFIFRSHFECSIC